MHAAGVLPFSRAPGGELIEVDQVETFEQLAFEYRLEFHQTIGRNRVQARRKLFADPAPVERGLHKLELDAFAVCDEAARRLGVNHRPDLRQTPTQRATRVVCDVPQ